MPKILRFMSAHEAIHLLQGGRLGNRTNHWQVGGRSTSVGFCFAIPKYDNDRSSIYYAAKYLSGIVDMDVCLVASLKDNGDFMESEGHYSVGKLPERCVVDYSLKDFSEWALYTPIIYGPEVMRVIPRHSRDWEAPMLTASSEAARA